MKIEIRQEEQKEYCETEAMARRAFFNKFGPGCMEHLMIHRMRKHPMYLKEFSRIAVVDGQVAGTIMYFLAKLVADGREISVPSFGPLCVDHKYKNHGIGSRLLQETLPLLKEAGYPGVIIMGEPYYYPKHGFVRAGSLGLTDAQGNTFDAFMAIEFTKGALSIPGGRFVEPADLCEFEEAEVEEFDKNFEYIGRMRRPCQWTYPNPNEKENGYRLEYAISHPREFEQLFQDYVVDLAQYADDLKGADATDFVKEIWENVTDASYVIMVGDKPAGLFVCSVPAKPVEEGDCTTYLQELYVAPAYRKRGIARDIILTFIEACERDTGFCITKESPSGEYFLRILEEKGYSFRIYPEDEYRVFVHVEVK